jgi:hypothetical protein
LGRQGTSEGYDCNIRLKAEFFVGKNNLDCRGQFWEQGNAVTPIIHSGKNLGTGFKPISLKTLLIPIRETVGPTGTVGSLMWVYNQLKMPNNTRSISVVL